MIPRLVDEGVSDGPTATTLAVCVLAESGYHRTVTFTAEEEAGLAIMAALTSWYSDRDGTDLTGILGVHDPGAMVGVLFGLFTAAIEDLAEIHEMSPQEWVQGLALTLQHEIGSNSA